MALFTIYCNVLNPNISQSSCLNLCEITISVKPGADPEIAGGGQLKVSKVVQRGDRLADIAVK